MDEAKPKPRPKRRKLTFSQYYNASQIMLVILDNTREKD